MGMDGCFSIAQGRQPAVDNQPLVTLTFWDFLFSQSDGSISRKSHLVTIRHSELYYDMGKQNPLWTYL
jgi:hypothetical protein